MNPSWTVLYNIVSPERGDYVGTGWEFFRLESDAQACYDRLLKEGKGVTKRPYHDNDYDHLGGAHKWGDDAQRILARQRQRFERACRSVNPKMLFLPRDGVTGEYKNRNQQVSWEGWKLHANIYHVLDAGDL